MAERARKHVAIRWALRLLGPLMLIAVIARLPDRAQLAAHFVSASWALVGLAMLVNGLAVHLKVARWQAMLATRGVRYRTRDAWLAFCSSLYLSMLTPGRVGDVLRIQYLRHDQGVRYAEGLASIAMDRLCDLYVLAAFVAIAITRFSQSLSPELASLSWGVVALTVLGPLVLLVPGISERLFALAYRRLARTHDAEGLAHFLAALRAQVGRPLLVTLPLTLVSFLVTFGQGYVIARALGIALSYFDVMCLLSVTSLLGLLPISVAGVGVREAVFAQVFPALGHTAGQGVALGLLVFVVIYLGAAAMGAVAWQIKPPPTGPGAGNTP